VVAPVEPVVAGRLTSVYGIKGWVKVYSHTLPRENLFNYSPWWTKTTTGWQPLNIDQHRRGGKDMLIHIAGIDDRDEAMLLCKQDIYIEKGDMPALPKGEFYWHQLEGLVVITHQNQQVLGVVSEIMETGANDVLVVKGDGDSIDREERLIPYIDHVVLKVDLDAGEIEVDWDPEF